MSALMLLSDALDDLARLQPRPCSSSLFDQHFGLGVLPSDLFHPLVTAPLRSGYLRPWRHLDSRTSGRSDIQNTKDAFKVNLDVQQFKPEEVNVKLVDQCVVVEGKHEEREDEHGFVRRHFCRRYRLPDDVDPDALVSKLSSDGILSIEAPKKALAAPDGGERVIQITQTNAPALTNAPKKAAEKPTSSPSPAAANNMEQ